MCKHRVLAIAVIVLLCTGAFAEQMEEKPRVFNVLKYGAIADDKTDNTAAFSACLKAVVEEGGGRMCLPDGVYRGRIVIPPVSKPVTSWITVEIAGESAPTPVYGTIGAFPLMDHGAIVKDLDASGAAVISASSSPNAVYGDFSAVNVVIKDLEVRTYDDPGIGGIDLEHLLVERRVRVEAVEADHLLLERDAGLPQQHPRPHGPGRVVLVADVEGEHRGLLVLESRHASEPRGGIDANARPH